MIEQFSKHKVAANLTMILMVLAGLWAVRSMPTQLDPPSSFPLIRVEIAWIGASAEDIESLVTLPIEHQLRTLPDLKELQSYTENGFTQVAVILNHDADVMLGIDQVKQRVAAIRNLPADIETPMIRPFIDREPITSLLISGPGTASDLIPLVREMEQDLQARGVSEVFYDGLPEQEIGILVGAQRLYQIGLTLDELAAKVARASQNVPAGTVGEGQTSKQLRSLDQRRGPLEFEKLNIPTANALTPLGDIAEVVRRPRRGQPQITSNGKATIEMTLWRATADDALRSNEIVQAWLADVRPTLSPGVSIVVNQNIWDLLGTQLNMLMSNALTGLILVVGVLYLFLNVRAAWWVMVGIPVSFLMALAFFYFIFGYGISIIALIAFIMALGIVVDDAIVVGEDVVTHVEQGMSASEAAYAGAKRMWIPVATSSLTTLAAFIPLLIMGGEMGAMILALPTALLCVILASLIECFLVLPGHLKTSLKHYQAPPPNHWRHRFDTAFENFRTNKFMPVVRLALNYPGTTVWAAIGGVVVGVSLVASQHVSFNLVTGFDTESLDANVEFSSEASDTQKHSFLANLEQQLQNTHESTGSVNLTGWQIRQNLARFDDDRAVGEQYASVNAAYALEESRNISADEFAKQWRAAIEQPGYVEKLTVRSSGGANNGQSDITLVLSGNNLTDLQQGTEKLTNTLRQYPGINNVTDNLPYGKEQVIFEITPLGESLGLSAASIGAQLRAAYSGSRVQIFNENLSELEVRTMLPEAERENLGRLQQFPIRTGSGEFLPLASVAELRSRRGVDIIRHHNSRLAVRINADVDFDVTNALAVTTHIQEQEIPKILEAHNLTFGLGGKSADDKLILETMALGGMLTLVLIYLILTWVFSSYLWPLAIMMAIPFGFTGAVLGHWLTGWDIGAMSLLAFFSLVGIVVNDSIVLISFFRRHVEAGAELKAALLQAVEARFRAVLLTSLTTIAGLFPLLFVKSSLAMYVTPIAITVCFGLAFATLLVLLVIPALIVLLEAAKAKTTGWLSQSKNQDNKPHWEGT